MTLIYHGWASSFFLINITLMMNDSFCYNTNQWETLCKYARKFVKAGVKLRRSSYDIWMEFAARVGKLNRIKNVAMLSYHHLVTSIFCYSTWSGPRWPKPAAELRLLWFM